MKRKFKQLHVAIISAIFAFVLVIATVVPASATFTQLRVDSWDVMSLTFNHPEGTATSGSAGEFTVSLYDDEEEEWGGPQVAFCVDLDAHIGQETYDIESMLQPEPVEIAWLMHTYSPVSTTVAGAAVQSGIWEVLYGDAFTLNGPSDVVNSYNSYMNALGSATMNTDYLLSNYSVVNLNGHQNLLVQNSSSAPVPEPTTMLLLGAGLLGLAGVRKKKIK